MGTDMENIKDGTFHKDFSFDMIFLSDIMHHVFRKTKVLVHTKPSTNINYGR